MAAFADYLDLRVAVAEQVNNSRIADVMPRLVLLGEAWLNRKLRHKSQMTEDTVTLTSGIGALPTDYLEMIAVTDGSGLEYSQVPIARQMNGLTGRVYSIRDTNMISAGLSGDLTVNYFAKIPTLTTSDTTTNWLLRDYPGLYLHTVATEAAKYLRDAGMVEAFTILRDGELDEAQSDSMSARYSMGRIRAGGVKP